MAVVGNTCSAIGDVLLITPGTPILGLTALVDYSDTIIGETGTRYFDKYFRYTINGIHYSNWIVLTNLNLQAVSVSPSNIFLIEYRYVRAGTDNTGLLEFVDITLNGTYGTLTCGFYYNNSIFKLYFECYDDEVASWCVNVLNKIYEEGTLPAYIERGEGATEDEDFINFWKSIGCYLAFFVLFARKIEDFYSDKDLISEYLKQRNVFICESSSDLADLVYIMWHYYQEIRHRGTIMIAKRKGDVVKAGIKAVNGELLRLFCVGADDEFIFQIVLPQFLGWNLMNSSPMWRGLTNQIAVNKAWEDTRDIVDLNVYPLLESSYIDIWQYTGPPINGGNEETMRISEVPASTSSGISPSQLPLQGDDIAKAIIVSPYLSYEITFFVKQDQLDSNFTFGVYAFDSGNNQINLQAVTVPVGDPSSQNDFFVSQNLSAADRWYFVRGIIYAYPTDPLSSEDAKTNLGLGNHLRFKTTTTVKIIPKILNEIGTASPGNAIKLWDIKVRPLWTLFSTCFLQVKNFIFIWVIDNNFNLTQAQKEEIIRRYLLPYNSSFTNIYIGA